MRAMKKILLTYPKTYMNISEDAWDEVQGFIQEEFGDPEGDSCVLHEIESEYVHTDVIVNDRNDSRTFVTFNAGVVPTLSPIPDYRYVEYVMYASKPDEIANGSDVPLIGAELQRISKYPFRNQTWLGHGHTLNTTEKFRERFGYEFVLFLDYQKCLTLQSEDEGDMDVHFLVALPIYEDERDWMVRQQNPAAALRKFMEAYAEMFDDADTTLGFVDRPRQHVALEG